MADEELILNKIKEQGEIVRMLKASKAQKEQVDKEVLKLLELKAQVNDKSKGKLVLKNPKGSRDYGPAQMALRLGVIDKVVKIFKLHGAETLDTPVFEMKDILCNKYGEDSKLIFDLADQGGEKLALRYDLTVPFARYLAMNKVSNIKRYQIAKVYRRDNPVMTKGRYREFIQCDFDIAGVYDPMAPDSECVRIVCEILDSVNVGSYKIKVNHRKILDGIFEVSGVPKNKFREICSSVDKLDKVTWAEARKEMVEEKGLDEKAADQIGEFVKLSGGSEVIEQLAKDERFSSSKITKEGLEDMQLFFKYCKLYGIEDKVMFDVSLARGLDYYTGVIFEAVLSDKKVEDENGELGTVGSVAGGGRYDQLVSSFDPKQSDTRCVGVSIGIERIFTILESELAKNNQSVRTTEVEVFVATAHKGLLEEKIKTIVELWNANIKAEQSYKQKAKLLDQLQYCESRKIPLAIILGKSEIDNGLVKIRDVVTRVETDVPRSDMISELKSMLSKLSAISTH